MILLELKKKIKVLISLAAFVVAINGILLPKETPSREIKLLDGIWNFKLSHHFNPDQGFRETWYSKPLKKTGDVIAMPVPSSYNDITCNKTIRDHVGWAWYDTKFIPPKSWKNDTRVVLRFGSVYYTAIVYLNGISVLNHSGGHLPFEAEVTGHLKYGSGNLLTVAVNNTLTTSTVPQGKTTYYNESAWYPPGYYTMTYPFDFFNYAGIHRSVMLYTTPKIYISDVNVNTVIGQNNLGMVKYSVSHFPPHEYQNLGIECIVTIFDNMDDKVTESNTCSGNIHIQNVKLWWPVTMHPSPGYLYKMQISLKSLDLVDIYELKIGIRSVSWNNKQLLINGKPFYFTGFGMHEDSDIRGKGVDLPLIIRNFNMIDFLNANSFRTSHYPYADEILDQADERGIVVIEETPAVSLSNFGKQLLKQHLHCLEEMIDRDKNRPSVVMWSLANEPKSSQSHSGWYFRSVSEFARKLDKTRPITAVLNAPLDTDRAAQYVDIICVNRYFSWYSDPGKTQLIQRQVINEYSAWNAKHNKPIITSEYGAGSITNLHQFPTKMFTEDYQAEVLINYHKAFDELRKKGFFIGEHIWNFADFMTAEGIKRVDGNRKGILTRNRQPKMSAYIIRKRYAKVAKENYNFSSHDSTKSTFSSWPHIEL